MQTGNNLPAHVKAKIIKVLEEIYKYNPYAPRDIKSFFERIKNVDPEIIDHQLEKFYKGGVHRGLFYLLKMITNYEENINRRKEIERQIYGDHSKVKVLVNGKWKIREKNI